MTVQFSDEAEKEFQDIVSRYPNTLAALLPALHLAQAEFGWISVEVMDYLAIIDEKLDTVLRSQTNQVLARLDGYAG